MCFRLSGDEFVVLFHNTNRHAVDGLMTGVLERLKVRREQLGLPYSLEFSFGCFKVMPGCGMTVTEVLSKADERNAPISAKRNGGFKRNKGLGISPRKLSSTIRCACTMRW